MNKLLPSFILSFPDLIHQSSPFVTLQARNTTKQAKMVLEAEQTLAGSIEDLNKICLNSKSFEEALVVSFKEAKVFTLFTFTWLICLIMIVLYIRMVYKV